MKIELVETILTGGFPPSSPTMKQHTAESMLTHLVQCSRNGIVDSPKDVDKGLLLGAKDSSPKRLALCEEIQGKTPMKWNIILNDLLSKCPPQLCRDELALPKLAVATTWREASSRKVLAPLTLKENTDNIIAGKLDMSRKRKSDVPNTWIPTKRARIDDTVKSCSVIIKKAPLEDLLLQYKCMSRRSFVRLYDITKEIPQVSLEEKAVTQNEYMRGLGLNIKQPSHVGQYSEVKISNPIKLASHPQIPFSSDYGRRLLVRERHRLPHEVALRKLDRTEWYLKGGGPAVRNNQYSEAACKKRSKYTHTYKFPKRQNYQNHQTIKQGFNRYLCKPVCVELKRIDLSPYLVKMKKVEENAPNTTVANESNVENSGKGEDPDKNISLSNTVSTDRNTKLLTLNCGVWSDNHIGDMKLPPRNIFYTEKARKRANLTAVSKGKLSKPRRSLRLNHTDASSKL